MKQLILLGLLSLSLSPACFAFLFPIKRSSVPHQLQHTQAQTQPQPQQAQPVPVHNVVNNQPVFPLGVNFWEGDLKYRVSEQGLVFNPYRDSSLLHGSQREYVQSFSPVTAQCVNVKTEELKFSSVNYNLLRSATNVSEEIKVDDEERQLMSSHLDIILNEQGFLVGLRLAKNASERGQRIKKTMAFLFILDPEYLHNVHDQHLAGLPYRVYENSVLGMCPTTYVTIFPQLVSGFSFPPLVNFTNLTPSEGFLSEKVDQKFCNPADLFVVIKEIDADHCKHDLDFAAPQPSGSKLISYYLVCGLNRRADTGRFTSFRILKIYQEGAGAVQDGGSVYLLTEVSLLSINRPHDKQQRQPEVEVQVSSTTPSSSPATSSTVVPTTKSVVSTKTSTSTSSKKKN